MKKTALIMAGGRGERFWPKSRQDMPKQFLSLTDDDKTMIQLTVERIRPLVDIEDIYIATNQDYRELVRRQLPELPEQNILCEPVGKNTAPCIGLGAMHIAKKYEDALMFVLPSDHLIKMDKIFLRSLQDACDVAEQGENLVTIGITPNSPETGYGYIRFDASTRWKGISGGAICRKTGLREGQGISGFWPIYVEQRHVHMEGIHNSEKYPDVYACTYEGLATHRAGDRY